MYDVVVINEKTGVKIKMNDKPMNHAEAVRFRDALTRYPWRLEEIEEVKDEKRL